MPENTLNEQRVWLVTGASSGFGRAISEAVLELGDRLAATSRSPESLKDLGDVLALQTDVTDPDSARDAVAEVIRQFGRLDVLVNNAGYGHVGAVEELTDDDIRRQFDVNLFGVVNMTRAALPRMREQRSGHLIQMSSLNGVEGLAGGACYAASKFAVEGFSESLAVEVAHLGIKVTIVEPGPHRTRFVNDASVRWAEPMDDYVDSTGKTRELLGQLDGNQPGDPRRAAGAIIAAVLADEPPRRLPLGRMALDNIRGKLDHQLSELDQWARLSASSDYPASV